MTISDICGGLSCGRRSNEDEVRPEGGCLRGRTINVITASSTAAILVIACLGISGVLSPLLVGATTASIGGFMFALHAVSNWRNSPPENKSIAPYCRAKVLLGLCGYTVLFGVLGATGVISGSALGWAIVTPAIAVVAPSLLCCCCCCASVISFLPCVSAMNIAICGGPEEEVRAPVRAIVNGLRNGLSDVFGAREG